MKKTTTPTPTNKTDTIQDNQKYFYCIGFLYPNKRNVPVDDYFDFLYLKWHRHQLFSDLRCNVLPTGLLLQTPNDEIVLVVENELQPFYDSLPLFMINPP